MQHAIRPAVTADRAAVEELVQQAYGPWVAVIGGRPAPMDADYAALIADGRVHVADAATALGGESPHGVIVLIPEDDVLLVDNVAVDPALHGQGIGRQLLAFAEEEARRLGLPAVRLFTHEKMTRNIALYEAVGYRHTGRQPINGGDLVHMRKQLAIPHGGSGPH
jgi:GNAT superfamily N-acetyltransferase